MASAVALDSSGGLGERMSTSLAMAGRAYPMVEAQHHDQRRYLKGGDKTCIEWDLDLLHLPHSYEQQYNGRYKATSHHHGCGIDKEFEFF